MANRDALMKGIDEQSALMVMCRQWLNLLDELNIGAFTVGSDRHIVEMNYAAQALMGLKENEVQNRDCREIFTGVPCMVECILRSGDEPVADEPEFEIIQLSCTGLIVQGTK